MKLESLEYSSKTAKKECDQVPGTPGGAFRLAMGPAEGMEGPGEAGVALPGAVGEDAPGVAGAWEMQSLGAT